MGNIFKYIKEFCIKQTSTLKNFLKKKKSNFFFYSSAFNLLIVTNIFKLKSFSDFIINMLHKDSDYILFRVEQKNYTKNVSIFFQLELFGFIEIDYFFSKKFNNFLGTLYLYFNYYYCNFSFFSKNHKNSPINIKLLQTKNNYQYKYSNKGYKNFLNLFGFGLKSIWYSLKLWVIPTFIFFFIVYYCAVTRLIPLNKIIFQ